MATWKQLTHRLTPPRVARVSAIPLWVSCAHARDGDAGDISASSWSYVPTRSQLFSKMSPGPRSDSIISTWRASPKAVSTCAN